MKKLLAGLITVLALGLSTGCYKTQEGRVRGGMPFSQDTIESRYERPADQIFRAARETLAYNGTLTGENTIARTLVAKVGKATVWVRVDQPEASIGRLWVQARNANGRGDLVLAGEIDKQTALRLKVLPIN